MRARVAFASALQRVCHSEILTRRVRSSTEIDRSPLGSASFQVKRRKSRRVFGMRALQDLEDPPVLHAGIRTWEVRKQDTPEIDEASAVSDSTVSISIPLSLMIRWVTHLRDGCMHAWEYLSKPADMAAVRISQSQLEKVTGRNAKGARVKWPSRSTIKDFGIQTDLLVKQKTARSRRSPRTWCLWVSKKSWCPSVQCHFAKHHSASRQNQAQIHVWQPGVIQTPPAKFLKWNSQVLAGRAATWLRRGPHEKNSPAPAREDSAPVPCPDVALLCRARGLISDCVQCHLSFFNSPGMFAQGVLGEGMSSSTWLAPTPSRPRFVFMQRSLMWLAMLLQRARKSVHLSVVM